MRPYIIWPWICGLSFLSVGVLLAWRRVASAHGLERLAVLAPVFVAAPLAAFAAEHMTISQFIVQVIPGFFPARTFLVYFVGVGLFAAATSFVLRKLDGLAASLLALMFVIFVVTMHVPNALTAGGRNAWIVALRDLSFGGGAMAIAAARGVGRTADGSSWLGTLGRVIVATACVVFGVMHFVQPTHAPGVPLAKLMPPWIPVAVAWGYIAGALEVAGGAFMLANRRTREVAEALGLVLLVLVVVVYLPVVAVAVEGNEQLEALNYVFDTLLFAGTVLALALPARDSVQFREKPAVSPVT